MNNRAGRGRRLVDGAFVACFFCLLAVAGQSWRGWQFERRGVEQPSAADVERRPGINVELTQYSVPARERALDDVVSLGFHWVRQRFSWRAIEPRPGDYDWEPWDALVQAVQARGLGLIVVLDDPPAWAQRHDPYPLPCVPPCDERAYARFVKAVAQRYGHAVDYYQVWDEPNLSRSWGGGHVAPCGYAVLLQAAYPAIHGADPTAWVLGGGLAPTQALGPDNLNDLVYLRQLYAVDGDRYLDILAVKPYGFWSGPEDRRVDPDVLNFSRIVAVREWMRAQGDQAKPIWAVEWGWNVLPEAWDGDPPPWGGDEIAMQRPRILGAVARARTEWPWLGVMCWAEYQPHVPSTDPRWSFALRDPQGRRTALYDLFPIVSGQPDLFRSFSVRWGWILALLVLALPVAVMLWWRLSCGGFFFQAWQWWRARRAVDHAGTLLVLAVLYAITPWPEWVALEVALALACFVLHPRWALLGSAFGMPFFYAAKSLGEMWIPPSEILLLLAAVAIGLWYWKRRWRLVPPGGWTLLDGVWGLWVAIGLLSVPDAPDTLLAWREWRLCMLEPALFYLCLRLWKEEATPGRRLRGGGLLLVWVLSGASVALIGIGQWVVGAIVPAGSVGRISSVYYSPNHLALYLERIWPLPIAVALCGPLERKGRRVAWGIALLIGAGLFLTFSRGAWILAVPAALLCVGGACRRRLRWWAALVGGVALLVAISYVLSGRWGPGGTLLEEVRLMVWKSTVRMIADHPWRGVGLDGFRFVYPRYMRVEAWTEPVLYHPHNVWLDAAVRLGFPGLALFVALVGGCLFDAHRWVRAAGGLQKAVAVGCLAGLLAAVAHGMVDSGYFLFDLSWSLALVAGTIGSNRGGGSLCRQKAVT